MKCINCGCEYSDERCPKCGLSMQYNRVLYRWEERQQEKQRGEYRPKKKKRKKPIYKKWWFWVAIVFVFTGAMAAIFGSDAESQKQSENTSLSQNESDNTPNEQLQAAKVSISKEELVKRAINADYSELLRNPDNYVGKYVVVTVKLYQILESGWLDSNTYCFGRTDQDGYELYFDDEYCFIDKRTDDNTKILDDDILTVYGVFNGLQTFERALTSQTEEIPVVEMLYADIGGSPDAVDVDAKITLEEYNKIENGMSYEEVVEIIGSEGQLDSDVSIGDSDEHRTLTYSWNGVGSVGSSAIIQIQGGEVVSKMQFGLE